MINSFFNFFKLILRESQSNNLGEVSIQEVAISYGQFIETFLDFLIVGFTIFIVVKFINRLNKKAEDPSAGFLNIDYVTNCTKLDIENGKVTLDREIDGGKETLTGSLPIIIGGQKGLVEESDLRIPNMRGIMQARQKPLDTIESFDFSPNTSTIKFHKPEPKQAVKLVDSDNLDELINLLHKEAKVL